MNKRKVVFDMALNIVAAAIPTFVLQLLILPNLAKFMSDDNYGLLVTVLAFLNVVPSTTGNVLNNIRLLYNENYIETNNEGDFNVLLAILEGFNFLSVTVFLFYYDSNLTLFTVLMTGFTALLWLAREYFLVAFRLIINYKAILLCNVIMVGGYGIGYLLFLGTRVWQVIYICGLLCSLAYCFIRSRLWKEPFKITPLFKHTSNQGLLLLIAKILNRLLVYADKIIVFPVLGGALVSVYYAATVFGKVVSLMITPVNSVVLTYLAKVKSKTDSMLKSALLVGFAVCAVGYIVCVLISRPVLSILYPQYVDNAMNYIYLTTGTTVLYALISIVDPFIMKFFDMKWQIAINGGTVVVYLALGISLMIPWGLMGFCVGALLTNVLKLLFMIFTYYRCKALDLEKAE